MKGLLDLGKPYKFIGLLNWTINRINESISLVNCTIMQKNGAGLIQSTSSYWDTLADRNNINMFALSLTSNYY